MAYTCISYIYSLNIAASKCKSQQTYRLSQKCLETKMRISKHETLFELAIDAVTSAECLTSVSRQK